MKRDWELVRKILLELEQQSTARSLIRSNSIEGYDDEVVSYHIHLLIEAGLIRGWCSETTNADLDCTASRLKWEGHEFLDKIRSDTIWNKTKALLKEKGVELTVETIKIAVSAVVRGILGA